MTEAEASTKERPEYPQRSWGTFSNPAYSRVAPLISGIPPTQRLCGNPKYHPRQWVDSSSSTYTSAAFFPFPNPPHGSVGILQAQPTQAPPSSLSEIPHTAVWGYLKLNLHNPLLPEGRLRSLPQPRLSLNNPPTGSGWDSGREKAGFL